MVAQIYETTGETAASLIAEIADLRRQRNAIILAHNYEYGEIQEIADYVGDSLGMAQAAARTDADVIMVCGVYFMAETAAILNPQRTVLIPDANAGCSLADSITVEQLRAWKAANPGAVVVSYVNTSAAVKAESDYCFCLICFSAVIYATKQGDRSRFGPASVTSMPPSGQP